MNKDNAHRYLPLVRALAEGKTIQHSGCGGGWYDADPCHFSLPPEDYRIKPEPRVIWLNEYSDQSIIWTDQHTTKAAADTAAMPTRIRCVKFVECLE